MLHLTVSMKLIQNNSVTGSFSPGNIKITGLAEGLESEINKMVRIMRLLVQDRDQ